MPGFAAKLTGALGRLAEDAGLSARDIGTPRDVGTTDPGADGSYARVEDLDTFVGVARSVARGALQRAVARGLTAPRLTSDLLQKAVAAQGSVLAAIDHLCFSTTDRDGFDGARLELRGGSLVGYNGYRGEQLLADLTTEDPQAAFVRVGAFVLGGMARSLAERLLAAQR